jgi:hypothetical protein
MGAKPNTPRHPRLAHAAGNGGPRAILRTFDGAKTVTTLGDVTKDIDPMSVVREFATVCANTSMAYSLYRHLFEQDQHRLRLYDEIAPLTFHDLSGIVGQYVLLQFAKLTDPAKTGRHFNLTSNYIVEMLPWPDDVRVRLAATNDRLMEFRAHIEEGRSKRIAHTDLAAQMARLDRMGGFLAGADRQFLRDLQEFVDIAAGEHISLNVAMSDDVYLLVRALEKAKLYEGCVLCDDATRARAVLDYEDRVNEENSRGRT